MGNWNVKKENEKIREELGQLVNEKEEKIMAKKEIERYLVLVITYYSHEIRLTEKVSEVQQRLDDSMAREVQIESEMIQEKRARLDEKNSATEKLTKLEKQLEHEKTRFTQSFKGLVLFIHSILFF